LQQPLASVPARRAGLLAVTGRTAHALLVFPVADNACRPARRSSGRRMKWTTGCTQMARWPTGVGLLFNLRL